MSENGETHGETHDGHSHDGHNHDSSVRVAVWYDYI